MGMFLPEDKFYDETKRQVGFNRYKQLLSRHFKDWFALNAITILGLLPLAAGIFLGLSTSSILVLLPASALGGAIFGPFLSGLYDAFYRAFRDDPMPWRRNYAKSWKQNWRCSLLPGAVLGVLLGFFCFLLMLFWYARVAPGVGTVALCIASAWLSLALIGGVLAAAGAVPAVRRGAAAQLPAVSAAKLRPGAAGGNAAIALLGGVCALRPVDHFAAAHPRHLVSGVFDADFAV